MNNAQNVKLNIRDRIQQAQEEALRSPWSGSTRRKPVFIEFSDRVTVGLSLNK